MKRRSDRMVFRHSGLQTEWSSDRMVFRHLLKRAAEEITSRVVKQLLTSNEKVKLPCPKSNYCNRNSTLIKRYLKKDLSATLPTRTSEITVKSNRLWTTAKLRMGETEEVKPQLLRKEIAAGGLNISFWTQGSLASYYSTGNSTNSKVLNKGNQTKQDLPSAIQLMPFSQ